MKGVKIFLGLILTLAVTFTAFFGVSDKTVAQDRKKEYKGIITLWQVDSFEGGTGSRKQFLLKVARGFEKQNDGVLVMVSNYTASGVKENFEKGIYPDLISYGLGLDLSGLGELAVSRSVKGGVIGGKVYATAWARGGYALIANPNLVKEIESVSEIEKVVVSQGEYTQPLTALCLDGITASDIVVKPPMDAYVQFVGGKTPFMVGTQRDIVRLSTRGMDVIATPLKEYNDLYQYISLTSTDALKQVYAMRFIEYLLSDNVQQKLSEISLLSPYIEIEHQLEGLRLMQEVDSKSTLSVFTLPEQLKQMQEYSLAAVKGDKNGLNKIKNLVV